MTVKPISALSQPVRPAVVPFGLEPPSIHDFVIGVSVGAMLAIRAAEARQSVKNNPQQEKNALRGRVSKALKALTHYSEASLREINALNTVPEIKDKIHEAANHISARAGELKFDIKSTAKDHDFINTIPMDVTLQFGKIKLLSDTFNNLDIIAQDARLKQDIVANTYMDSIKQQIRILRMLV